jgi:orotate phosphoribosyltransferase
MSVRKLIQKFKEVGALRFGEFTLSSGKKSNVYVDVKHACTFPDVLEEIANQMAEKLRNVEFHRIACVELGGVPLAVALSLKTRKPYLIFRKAKKDYGVESDAVGDIRAGEKIVVVEDVTTTGTSAASVVERVEKKGGRVVAVLTVVDRMEGAEERLRNLIALMRLDELMKE